MRGLSIFISIASYRDVQLVPTVRDCLAKARHPERLRFGICWQRAGDEAPLPFADDMRFQILDVPWRESRGACWARSEIMKLWRGEPWFLQVDSHCRFAAGWDRTLIEMAALTGSPKPVLSTYAPPFTPAPPSSPDERELLGGEPQLIAFQGFDATGIPALKPMPIPRWQHRSNPVRARFLAAGFLFAPGSFAAEVPYDPELYFIGEEIAMTLRAFTHGYDLFHPCTNVVWHDYVRGYAIRHWDDHTAQRSPGRDWGDLDRRSRRRIAQLLAGEPLGRYGLGTIRTLADYESYAGLSFSARKGQNATLLAVEPPNAPAPPHWADEIYTWMVRIGIDVVTLPPGSLDDPLMWCVAIRDEDDNEIFRRDFPRAELRTLPRDRPRITLVCEFQSGIVPASWSVTPLGHAGEWLGRIKGALADQDYAIIREDEVPG